jgi:hypothetical protein
MQEMATVFLGNLGAAAVNLRSEALKLETTKTKKPRFSRGIFWWQEPGTIRRHYDFQSYALPTELSCQSGRKLERTCNSLGGSDGI